MKQLLLTGAVAALYLLHQDVWFWRTAQPIAFGFLPIGVSYHVCYTLAVVVLMGVLVRFAWPAHLEQEEHD